MITHTNYNPFALLADLEYAGDFPQAAQTLRQQGYGTQSSYSSHYQTGGNLDNTNYVEEDDDCIICTVSTAENKHLGHQPICKLVRATRYAQNYTGLTGKGEFI